MAKCRCVCCHLKCLWNNGNALSSVLFLLLLLRLRCTFFARLRGLHSLWGRFATLPKRLLCCLTDCSIRMLKSASFCALSHYSLPPPLLHSLTPLLLYARSLIASHYIPLFANCTKKCFFFASQMLQYLHTHTDTFICMCWFVCVHVCKFFVFVASVLAAKTDF